MTDFANHRAIGLGHDVEFRGPAEKARGERTKANGHASGQDGDRFKWKTAQTTEGPILSGLWLVKGVIPCRGVGAMFGRPGCGKTFVGTDIGLCVAGAIEWRGLKVRQCETVMLSMEAGQAGENRVHAWMRYHSRPWPPEFRMSPVTLNFRSTRADAEALVLDIASRGKKVGLIIVDTLARAMCGGNENASEDMGALIANCEWLAAELDCFVLLIHHCGKDEAKGLRGHTSLLGAIDTEIELKRQRGQPGLIVLNKQRDGQDGAKFAFDLQSVTLGHDEDGDPVTSCVAVDADAKDVPQGASAGRLTPAHRVALAALSKAIGDAGKPLFNGPDQMPRSLRLPRCFGFRWFLRLDKGSI